MTALKYFIQFDAVFDPPEDFDADNFIDSMAEAMCNYFGHELDAKTFDCPVLILGVSPILPEIEEVHDSLDGFFAHLDTLEEE